MSFNPELVQVSKTSGNYMNLVHGSGTITFLLKECYSHFGVTHNKKFNNYSIGLNIPEKLFNKLKAVESKAETLLDQPLTKPLLRSLVEKGEYRTLYLKPKPEQFNKNFLNEKAVLVSGVITVTAIFLGSKDSSLLIMVNEMTITKAPPREPKKPVVLLDSDDED